MKARRHYTVSEVVALSKVSESTVNRLVKAGNLTVVPGTSNPRRLTADSVHSYIRRLLDDGPQLPEGVSRNPDDPGPVESRTKSDAEAVLRKRIDELERTVGVSQAKVQELEDDNERLRNTVQGLKHAHEIVLDRLGDHTSPKIPNN